MVWFHKSSWRIQYNSYNQKACSLIQTMSIRWVLQVRPNSLAGVFSIFQPYFKQLFLLRVCVFKKFLWKHALSPYNKERQELHPLIGRQIDHKSPCLCVAPCHVWHIFPFLSCFPLPSLSSSPPFTSSRLFLCVPFALPFILIFTVTFTWPTNLIHLELLPSPLPYSPKYNPSLYSMGFLYPTYQSLCICLSVQSVQSLSSLLFSSDH